MRRFFYFILFGIILFSACHSPKSLSHRAAYQNLGPFLHYYEGIQNRLYGNIDKAIKNFESAIILDTTNDAVYYELAISYNINNDITNAILNIEQAIRLNAINQHYRSFYGMLLISTKDYEKAVSNQIQLLEIDSANVNYRFQLALLQYELKQFDNSIDNISKLEDQIGYNLRLAEIRLRIYLESNSIDKALDEVNRIVSMDETNPLYLLYKSDIYFKMGEDSTAFSIIKQVIDLNPDLPQTQVELYHRFIEIGDYSKALELLSKLFSENQIAPEEKARLFYPLLFDQKVYTTHRDSLNRIVNLLREQHPNQIYVHEIAFEHFIRLREFTLARESLQILTILDESNPDRWEKLITFDYSLQKREQVIYNSIEASKKFAEKSIFYLLQAFALDELHDTSNSILVLENAITNVSDPSEKAEIYGTLGDMYFKIQNISKAFKAYEATLSLTPNNARVLNNFSYYLALHGKTLSKALEMSTKAVDLEPNNSTYIDTKGWVLFQMKRYDEARDVLRNAIAKSGSTSAVINEHYGDALFKTGNKENAYIYWLKAKEIGGGSDKLEEKLRTKSYVP